MSWKSAHIYWQPCGWSDTKMNEKEKKFMFVDPAHFFPKCFAVIISSNSTNILPSRGWYQEGDAGTS